MLLLHHLDGTAAVAADGAANLPDDAGMDVDVDVDVEAESQVEDAPCNNKEAAAADVAGEAVEANNKHLQAMASADASAQPGSNSMDDVVVSNNNKMHHLNTEKMKQLNDFDSGTLASVPTCLPAVNPDP